MLTKGAVPASHKTVVIYAHMHYQSLCRLGTGFKIKSDGG